MLITCCICKKSFKAIRKRHLNQHNITFEEYVKMFPDAETTSFETRSTHRQKMTGKTHTPEVCKKLSEKIKASWKNNPNQGKTGQKTPQEVKDKIAASLKGHSVSEETRAKIGLSGLGRKPWNKNLTKFDDERLQAMSQKIKEWNKVHFTAEIKLKISQTLKKRYADGMKIPQSRSAYREDLNKYFRSKWEANFARALTFEGIIWEYEHKKFPFYDENGEIICVYTPDFFTDHYIEIKGHANEANRWTCNCTRCERDKFKLMLMEEQYPDIPIEIVGRKEYSEIATKYSTIPHWEKSTRDVFYPS